MQKSANVDDETKKALTLITSEKNPQISNFNEELKLTLFETEQDDTNSFMSRDSPSIKDLQFSRK